MNLDQYQTLVRDWVRRTFGDDIADNPKERALRVLEEALELAQVEGVTLDEAAYLTSVVMGRPLGAPFQEIGGVFVTLAAYTSSKRYSLQGAAFSELCRILNKDPEQFRARQREKADVGVGVPMAQDDNVLAKAEDVK